jgi:uncharacterized repeat protein (TIGR03803 family)
MLSSHRRSRLAHLSKGRSQRALAGSIEPLESRVLMSGYTLSTVISVPGSHSGGATGGVIDVGGNLYGTTHSGGGSSLGTVYEYNTSTKKLTTIVTFDGNNGASPDGGLIEIGGNLYGTTTSGGVDYKGAIHAGDGTVFEYNFTTKKESVLASFDGTNGADPVAGLLDFGGNLYGTTQQGGVGNGGTGDGTVFEYNFSTKKESVLVKFDSTNGAFPAGALIDFGGNLYGTTSNGGSANAGTLFEYSFSTKKESVLATFHGSNGFTPEGGLIDVGGNLFGTTYLGGGSANDGTVYEYNFSTKKESVLATFHGTNGDGPSASMIDVGGNLYGTTYYGGAAYEPPPDFSDRGDGTVFEYNFATKKETVVASLEKGTNPDDTLTDVGGDLYGTTILGGVDFSGTIFKLTPTT